jgi:hypothetical protein
MEPLCFVNNLRLEMMKKGGKRNTDFGELHDIPQDYFASNIIIKKNSKLLLQLTQ